MDKGMCKSQTATMEAKEKNGNFMFKVRERVNVSLVVIAYGSISVCTSCSGLVKLDRPMIENPGLVTLDDSLSTYCKTIWSSLTHTLILCSCQLA